MADKRRDSVANWHFSAAVAAWLVPGLGHWVRGERARACILLVSIMWLWVAGLMIGGVSVCDRRQHPAWFLGQMLVAPSWGVDYYNRWLMARSGYPSLPDRPHDYEPSYGHVNEQGILYTSLAGLLNLLAIIDVVYRDPQRRGGDARSKIDGVAT